MENEKFYLVQMSEQELNLTWDVLQNAQIKGSAAPILVSLLGKVQQAAQNPLSLAPSDGAAGGTGNESQSASADPAQGTADQAAPAAPAAPAESANA